MPYIIQGQAAKREPPAVPFIETDPDECGIVRVACPVERCDAWAAKGIELSCEHEYPGKCDACDTVVGDRYEELTWMGNAGWLCDRCNSRCEECDAEGVITFCGVCASCLRVEIDGVVAWPPGPVVRLCVCSGCEKEECSPKGNIWWERLD